MIFVSNGVTGYVSGHYSVAGCTFGRKRRFRLVIGGIVIYYISRCASSDMFYVMDTDKGKETLMTMSELYDLCQKETVEGVSHVGGMGGMGGMGYITKHRRIVVRKSVYAVPWQDKESMTRAQCKALMLKPYLNIVLNKDTITHIDWFSSKLPRDGGSVRLSDFGSFVAAHVLRHGNKEYGSGRELTLIVDDKVNIDSSAFVTGGLSSSGVVLSAVGVSFDLREVTNECLLKRIYKSIYANRHDPWDFNAIKDYPIRKWYYTRKAVRDHSCGRAIGMAIYVAVSPLRWVIQLGMLVHELLFLPKAPQDMFGGI